MSQQLTPEPAGETGEILADHHWLPELARASDPLALYLQTRAAGAKSPPTALGRMAGTLERAGPVVIATPDTDRTPRSPARITIRQAASHADPTAAATGQHHAQQVPIRRASTTPPG